MGSLSEDGELKVFKGRVHLYNRTGDDVTHTQEEGEEGGDNNNNSKITKWYIYMYESV